MLSVLSVRGRSGVPTADNGTRRDTVHHPGQPGAGSFLAGWLAIGARLTAWAMENPRHAAVAARGGVDFMKLDAITRLLGKLNEAGPGQGS
jgi:hypothetical protein